MQINAVTLAHTFLKQFVKKGDVCIDATAGRGRDTELLCELVGETGHVLSFDVQESAVQQTKERLDNRRFSDRARVILDCHSHMERYAQPESVHAMVFNFGYLPGGDHTICTKAETSIPAIEAGMRLLRAGGGMSLSLYYGGVTGYEERDKLLEYLQKIPQKDYTVLIGSFANRQNDPPISVWILKE